MQTIKRVIQLLELLSKYKDGLGINDISDRVDIPLSTTHRMLNSLKEHGYISQNLETKRYKLGIEVLTLAVQLLNNMDIVPIARPIIEELSTKYEQLIFLSMLEGNRVICVDAVNTADGMKFYVKIGSQMPAYCSASGKAIVAYQEEELIDNILRSEERKAYTNHTKLDIVQIKNELLNVKKLGYATCEEEMEPGVRALAVPIRGRDGSIYASITIMLLKHLEYDEEQIINDLMEVSSMVSKHLGFIK